MPWNAMVDMVGITRSEIIISRFYIQLYHVWLPQNVCDTTPGPTHWHLKMELAAGLGGLPSTDGSLRCRIMKNHKNH